MARGAGTGTSTHGIVDLRAGGSSVLWRAGDASGALGANRFSLGLTTQTQVIRQAPARLPPALGRPQLTQGGAVRSVLIAGRTGYTVEVAAANLDGGTPPEAFDVSAALSGLTVMPRAESFAVGFDVRDGLATTAVSAVLRVIAYAPGGASATVVYSWPLVGRQNPLAVATRDGDGDGIPDAYDWYRASTEMRSALLPVPVSDRSRDAAGKYPGHHIRSALPPHRLRSGAVTREHVQERSLAAADDLGYGDWSAAVLGDDDAGYNFELWGIDHDVGADGALRGGAAGVIIPLPLYLRETGMSLSQTFDTSDGSGYGFAPQDLSGGCPDDTRDAASPYRDDAGNLKNDAGEPGEGCLVLYIVEGGNNDEDGTVNGFIASRGIVVIGGIGASRSGNFGLIGLLLLALVMVLVLLSSGTRNRRPMKPSSSGRSCPKAG